MWTLQNAAILIALAALGGVTMLVIRLRGQNPPTWLALGHGLIALSGVGILGYLYQTASLPALANWALLVFLLAAAGGATLFLGFHLRGKLLPIALILGHGLIAATGFGLLLTALLR
jgi:hypothetical protein